MKIKTATGLAIVLAVLAAGTTSCMTEKQEAAKLEAKAKITRAEAEKIALGRAPNGVIKEGGIEKEKGRVIWSFDIATPGSEDITEVQVDAQTGEVVAVDKESPAQEAKEKAKDKEEEEREEKK